MSKDKLMFSCKLDDWYLSNVEIDSLNVVSIDDISDTMWLQIEEHDGRNTYINLKNITMFSIYTGDDLAEHDIERS